MGTSRKLREIEVRVYHMATWLQKFISVIKCLSNGCLFQVTILYGNVIMMLCNKIHAAGWHTDICNSAYIPSARDAREVKEEERYQCPRYV